MEAHGRALERLLEEAGSAGSRGWVPGAAELEAAALVLQLLARLVPLHARQPSPVALDLRLRAYQCAPAVFSCSLILQGMIMPSLCSC